MAEFFVHERALCESATIGAGSRIEAFAHVFPGAVIGAGCEIGDHVLIESGVRIGDRVTVKSGVQLWDGVRLEDEVFIGPNATFTNDRFPRRRSDSQPILTTLVRRGASVGANATLLPGIEIGIKACIGAGALVTHSIPPHAIVVGNPARIIGYVDSTEAVGEGAPNLISPSESVFESGICGVRLYNLPQFKDSRGDLSVGEFERTAPFAPKRYFLVYGVPSRETRGQHAHKACHQFLICVAGSCNLLVDDGISRREFLLNRPSLGIHLPPMVWGTLYNYSRDAVLLVFASDFYDSDDYIRDYRDFLSCIVG